MIILVLYFGMFIKIQYEYVGDKLVIAAFAYFIEFCSFYICYENFLYMNHGKGIEKNSKC